MFVTETAQGAIYQAALLAHKLLGKTMIHPDATAGSEIHPAPSEFSLEQLTADPILNFFHYAHLPPKPLMTSRMFFMLASEMIRTLPRNAERTVALRKLLEAKDAAVRANLPAYGYTVRQRSVAQSELGEPVEIGGHDEDRDGPVDFNG